LQHRHTNSAPPARPESSTADDSAHPYAQASDFLSRPAGQWDRVLTDIPAHHRPRTLKHLVADAEERSRTDPERAHAITSFVLRHIAAVAAPSGALLRQLLGGRALLAHARTLVALRAYDAALPLVAAAHAAVPRGRLYARYRMHAQLLRAQVFAAIGRDEEALDTLAVCALVAIEHTDDCALVDALTTMAVVLCTHCAFDLARSALILAEHVALKNGHERPAIALHDALAECAFFGYAEASATARR